ncbi:hypothetical protein HPP92_005185 [Vanilla planifolia]|uniref:Uncharacterized protein n=1 Tax=Vanilla planifolia TaxID=51239 RepID=A0A835RTK7_VANPL|nr:hypothetical protein HPP92_005185 [Vanilla planifolia]
MRTGEGSMGHHYPAAVSSQQNVNQHMLLSSTPCGPKQRVPCGQPPLIKRPAKLPPWLLHAEQQKQNQISDSLYCDQTPFSPACNMSGTNLNSHLSAYQAPMIPFSFPQCHCHRACSSFTPNACSPSFIAQVPATKSNTEFKKSINSRKNERGGIYSKFNGFTGSFDSLKLRKRQADIERVMNPAKKPCLAKQVDTDLRGGQNQMHKYALDKSTTLNFQRTENGKRECRITSGSSSSRFGKGLRSGPTKLIAGLKHILIPCQRIDDDYCRPIHTTRPFYSNAASGNFFGPEEKITNIYKF